MDFQALLQTASKHFRYRNLLLEHIIFPEPDFRYAFTLHGIAKGIFHYPHGISLKTLPCYAILYTFEGSARLHIQDDSYTLKKNTTAWINCTSGFDIEIIDTTKDWDFILVFASGNSLADYHTEFAKGGNLTISSQNSPAIPSTFHQLYSNVISVQEGSTLVFSKLLCDLMTYLALDRSIQIQYGEEKPDHIIQIINYIHNHYAEKITLDSIASHFAMSKYSLSRDFTTCLNQSLIDYLIDFRVEKSKKLLEFSSLSISEVAIATGFSTMNNYIIQFKKRTNLTPTAFRRQNQIYSSKQRLADYEQ